MSMSLDEQVTQYQAHRCKRWLLISGLLLGFLVCTLGILSFGMYYHHSQAKKLNLVRSERHTELSQTWSLLQKSARYTKGARKELARLQDRTLITYLTAVCRGLPTTLFLTKLAYEDHTLTIAGYADHQEHITQCLHAYSQSLGAMSLVQSHPEGPGHFFCMKTSGSSPKYCI